MAASEHTPHYSLSQFGPGDRPSWIDDYNADMRIIDTAIRDESQTVTDMTNEITDIKNRLGASNTVYNYFTWSGVMDIRIWPPSAGYIDIGDDSQGGLGDNDIINLRWNTEIQVNQDGIYCIWSSVNIGRFYPQLNIPVSLSVETRTDTEETIVHGSAATPLASDTDGTYTRIEQSLTLPPTVMSLRAGTHIHIFIDPRYRAETQGAWTEVYELESATGIVKIR